MLTALIQSQIRKECIKKPNEEVCGLLVESPSGIIVRHSYNQSPSKTNHFIISPIDYIHASEFGKIIGCYHSHINDNPNFSEYDKKNAEMHKLVYVLYSVKYDSFECYLPQETKNQYIFKEFKIGEIDCFSLIRNYYLKELNIQIQNFPRDDEWFKKNPKIIFENFKSQGFSNIFIENFDWVNLKKHDILSWGETPEKLFHFMVYVENNTILHHPRNKYSILEQLRPSIKSYVRAIFRHNSLNFV